MDGLGSMVTISNPSAGQGWTMTVPANKAWRPWGGSCRLVATSFVASRFPTITYVNGNGTLWFASQNHAVQANQDYRIAYHEGEVFLSDLYINLFIPVALKAIWLPAGTQIIGGFQNMQAADQVSEVGLLIEEVSV